MPHSDMSGEVVVHRLCSLQLPPRRCPTLLLLDLPALPLYLHPKSSLERWLDENFPNTKDIDNNDNIEWFQASLNLVLVKVYWGFESQQRDL
jgi:hypothetical protein